MKKGLDLLMKMAIREALLRFVTVLYKSPPLSFP